MASEGFSRINPLTKKPEYILPSGIIVPVTPATTKAIAEGKSDLSVLAEYKPKKPKKYSGGTSYSPSSVVPTQPFTPIPPSSQQVQINQEEIRQARQAEIQRKLAEAEKRRIEQIAMELKRKGAQEQQKITSNKQGEKIRTTTISLSRIQNGKDVSGMVFKYENLDTGEVRYRDYSGFRKKFSGGVDFSQQSSKDSRVIKKDLQESGLNPIIRNGQIVGFSSPDTMKTYQYSDAGIQAFNRDIQNSGAQLRQQARLQKEQGMSYIPPKDGKIVSIAKGGDVIIGKGATTVKKAVTSLLNSSGVNVNNIPIVNFISKTTSNLARAGINNIKKYKQFAESRREEAQRQLQSSKFNLKKPTTYTQALNWVRNFDRYVTNKAIVTAIDLGIATPQIINQLRKAPFATIALLPGAIKEGFIQDFKTLKSRDFYSITDLATEYLVYTATFGLAGKAVKSTSRGIRQILPGTKKLVNGQIVVRKATKGKPSLVLKSQTVKSGATSLSKQAKLAGKTVTAVTAQAQQLTSLIKRNKVIRKPIVGTTILEDYRMIKLKNPKVSNLLKKFDSGIRLTNKEFALVNLWLRKNIAPNITLLERSLYLDPASGLRVSRLGIQAERTAGLRDILRGNFKLFGNSNKPQILVFENAKVANFPKSLSLIKRKILAGKELTTAETNKLIRWQVQTGSGKFKPIGSTIYAGGRELEVTLAPGEMIKRIKSLGRVYIEGRKVTIVSAEVFKPSKQILSQLALANMGKLSFGQLLKLEFSLSKLLGRRIRVETPRTMKMSAKQARALARRMDPNIPVLRVRGLGIYVLPKRFVRVGQSRRTSPMVRRNGMKRNIPGRTPGRGTTIRRPPIRPGRTPPRPTPRTPGRTPPRKPGRGTTIRRPPGRRPPGMTPPRTPPPRTPPIRLNQKDFQRRTLSKSQPTYYVVEKRGGKLVKLYPKPLTMKDARDYATYSIDNRLSRTAFFIPLGKAKRVVRPPKNIQGYFSSNSRKFRPYKIRFGKKRMMVNGYIEKRKFAFDQQGERVKRKLTPEQRRVLIKRLEIARSMRSGNVQKKPIMVKKNIQPRRKLTPEQRRVLIKRLELARRVRMRNLRRR